jgi:hypothetical protein
MSTKTTFKRIALVTVAALGFGVLTSVAPASATALTTEYVTSISTSAATAPVAGNAGAAVATTVRFKPSTTATDVKAHPAVLLISSPATSNMTAAAANAAALTKGQYSFIEQSTVSSSGTAPSATAAGIALGATDSSGSTNNRAADGTALSFLATYLHAWYDVPGTYKWVLFDDLDESGTINGSEFSSVYTVVVADGTAAITATVAAFNSTSGVDSTNGSLVKITLKDAAGNAANVDSAGGVKVTVSGSAVIANAPTTTTWPAIGTNTTSSVIIPRTAINGKGEVWINVTNSVAEVVTVTVSGVGSTTISGNVPSLTFVSTAGTSTTTPVKLSTGSKIAGAAGSSTAGLGTTVGLKTGVAAVAAPVKEDVNVVDGSTGSVTGKAAARYSAVVTNGITDCTECGSFTIATGFTEAGQSFTVGINGGAAETITASRAVLTGGSIVATDATRTAAKGSTNSISITVKDQYGTAFASAVVTPSLSATSRNFGLVTFASLVTDAKGIATLTYTDAST